MEKLKHTIQQLNQHDFEQFENTLIKNKSDKFLYLTKKYRTNNINESDLQKELDCTSNAFYVLKSRLYDKIQKFILDNTPVYSNGEASGTPLDYNALLFEYPRETANAMMHEIENQLIEKDATHELINLYSALKKSYAYTDKHYIYSKLYNKQIAYLMALEKAEDTLINFNKTLANYYFSNSQSDLEILTLLKKEIKNIFALNKSKRIELILNTIIIQLTLFTTQNTSDEDPVEDLLEINKTIVKLYPNDYKINQFHLVNSFLSFEYYVKINQIKKATLYFTELCSKSSNWLLSNTICFSLKFLFSKIDFNLKYGDKYSLQETTENINFDKNDFYTSVAFSFYKSLVLYFTNETKKSITILNQLLNEISFVNFISIELEIKLTLVYAYCTSNDYEQADNLLKSISRKLNTEKSENYNNVKLLIKLLSLRINHSGKNNLEAKENALIEQFEYYNEKERKIVPYLITEIKAQSVLN